MARNNRTVVHQFDGSGADKLLTVNPNHSVVPAHSRFTAIDLFSGSGGLTLGLKRAGFRVVAAIDSDELSSKTYRCNHPQVHVVAEEITNIDPEVLMTRLGMKPAELDLLSGCPPCQGFSTMRTKNGGREIREPMNELVFEMVRFSRAFKPKAIMIENVPGLANDVRIGQLCAHLHELGYFVNYDVFDAADYGVPQRRKRMILLGGSGATIPFADSVPWRTSVKDAIGHLRSPGESGDPLHNYDVARSNSVLNLIRMIPKDGGSRSSLPDNVQLACHRKCDGFKDVYGRMAWSKQAPTITGGCINPSKGRYLHPEEDRAITLREAALLQGFPFHYEFRLDRGRYPAAQMIGNAFPPNFAFWHAKQVVQFLASPSGA